MRQKRSACLALPWSVRSLSAVKSVRPEPVEGLFFLLASFKKDGASTGSARTDHKIASGRKLRRIFVAIAVAKAALVDLFAAQLGARQIGRGAGRERVWTYGAVGVVAGALKKQ